MRNAFSKIFAVFLLSAFLLNTNYVIMYYGVFKLNQSVLAATVCEKKTEGCNGCCYLKKKLEQENTDPQSAAEMLKTKQKLSEFTVKYLPLPKNNITAIYLSFRSELILSEGYSSLPCKPPQTV